MIIAVTRRLPTIARTMLEEAGFTIRIHDEDDPPSRDALLALVRDADGLISLLSDRVDAALLDAAGPNLRVVANYAVGLDNVDLAACRARGIAVAHTPGVLTDATADLAWALLLAVARRVREGDALVRSGAWSGWSPLQLLGSSLSGRTFGVVGLGRIGAAAAQRARAFGMHVVYAGRTRREREEARLDARFVSMEDLLEGSDVVSLHCPSTPETRHLIDADALARMRSSAILVNTARGEVVDEAALVHALREGVIGGAGLDVFEREPLVHAGLVSLDNVVLAPHLGSATVETRDAMARMVADAMIAVLDGRVVEHLAVPPGQGAAS